MSILSPPEQSRPANEQPLLEVRRLVIHRGGRPVLREIDLRLGRGEIVALIGANGSGKSTLLHAIAGLLPIESGEVQRGRVCLLPDEATPCLELTVGEQLDFGARLSRATPELSQSVANRLGLAPLGQVRCGSLSRGEARRVLLHGALVSDLPLLLLDEPLGTFDPLQLLDVVEAIRAKARGGAAVLVTCHQLSDAEKLADRIVVLHGGRVLAQGTLEQLRLEANAPGAGLEQVFLSLLRSRSAAA